MVKVFHHFYWLDFRSAVSGKTGSYLGCSGSGFREVTSTTWSMSFNINYNDNQHCYWFLYNPYSTGSLSLSFSSFAVSLYDRLHSFAVVDSIKFPDWVLLRQVTDLYWAFYKLSAKIPTSWNNGKPCLVLASSSIDNIVLEHWWLSDLREYGWNIEIQPVTCKHVWKFSK